MPTPPAKRSDFRLTSTGGVGMPVCAGNSSMPTLAGRAAVPIDTAGGECEHGTRQLAPIQHEQGF